MGDGVPDRPTPADVSNLRVEDHGFPMHVSGLLILDGAPLTAPDGTFRLATVTEEIARRLHAAPRLRQRLAFPPRSLGPPVWVDDARFDIARHVRERAVPEPGDEAALLGTCEALNRPRLHRAHPLWELWFLTGLADGTVAMLLRLHHAVADGIAAVALLGALFDLEPGVRSPEAPAWVPRPVPTARQLRDQERERRRASLSRLADGLAHPSRWSGRIAPAIDGVRGLVADGVAPRTSLNASIGERRRLALVRAELAATKQVAHAHDGTVNDVVLAAVTSGARALLAGRGELRPDLELRASVPVSRRAGEEAPAGGNRVGVMIVPLPVGEPDPVRRLEGIVRATQARKRDPRTVLGWDVGSPMLQRVVVRVMHRQRLINLLSSNVPGPPVPLFFAGSRVLEAFQLNSIQGNVTLAVGALSYAGQLNLDVVADAERCPDADVFATGLRDALDGFGVAR